MAGATGRVQDSVLGRRERAAQRAALQAVLTRVIAMAHASADEDSPDPDWEPQSSGEGTDDADDAAAAVLDQEDMEGSEDEGEDDDEDCDLDDALEATDVELATTDGEGDTTTECPISSTAPAATPPSDGVLRGELAESTNASTSAIDFRRKCLARTLDLGIDANPLHLGSNKRKAACAADEPASSDSTASSAGSGFNVVNTAKMLLRREAGLGPSGAGFTTPERRHLQCTRHLPVHPTRVVDSMQSRAYIGQFSRDGSLFIAAYQDRRVRLYDVERNWALRKDVTTRMVRWTITDTNVSPDQRYLIYSSITPTVHMVRIGSRWDDLVDSQANVTEVHDALNFDTPAERSFGIWSVRWSGDGRHIIAGSNDQSVYLYDVEQQRVLARVPEHDDDVNAVAYSDGTSNTIISGSDDGYIRVWDQRTLSSTRTTRPAGRLVGHTEGITHLDPRGDGRYLISNSKDQSIKLWDLRKMITERAYCRLPAARVPSFNWDYRWQSWPGNHSSMDPARLRHPHDMSLMTYRGHAVLETLVRAYFSPAHSTGQRYLYTGSKDGCITIYDVVTGGLVTRLKYHRTMVRDCSWHPTLPMLASVSWDGSVVRWDCTPPSEGCCLPASGRTPMAW